MFLNDRIQTPIDFCEKTKHIRGPHKMFTLLCCPRIGLYKVRKLYWSWNKGPIGINNSTMNHWGKKEDRQVIWQQTPVHRISPICFHPNRLESGKDHSSSGAHLQSSKTNLHQTYAFLATYLNSIS